MSKIVTRFATTLLLLAWLCLATSATADDSTRPSDSENNLLGVWCLKQDDQIIIWQIFCQDHWFAQVRPGFGQNPKSPPLMQFGKWSVNGDILHLDYEISGRHTSPRFSFSPDNPAELNIIPEGAAQIAAVTWVKQEGPEKIATDALIGEWSYKDADGLFTGTWALQRANRYSLSISSSGAKIAESGRWELGGNQLKLSVVQGEKPADAGIKGDGKIVLLTEDWLLIDEQSANGRHYLDLFHQGELTSVHPETGRSMATPDLSAIKVALNLFELQNERFPTTDEGLKALVTNPGKLDHWEKTLDKLPQDPWGHPYIYRCPGSDGQDFDLLSAGPDGKEGTAD
jgi:type II secretion system protein G